MPIVKTTETATQTIVGAEHGATISLILDHSEAGNGPRLHRHPYDETWVVIAGDILFEAGEERHTAGPGDVVIVPASVPHKFTNQGPERASRVCIHASPTVSGAWRD